MRLEIEVRTEDADGNEIVYMLPARHEVCGRCEGHGTHLTPSIGEHCYSMEEFLESFPEEEDQQNYFRRGGIYDVTCERCGGKNVVPVVDRDACRTPQEIEGLKVFDRQQRDDAEFEQLVRSEIAHGC